MTNDIRTDAASVDVDRADVVTPCRECLQAGAAVRLTASTIEGELLDVLVACRECAKGWAPELGAIGGSEDL